MSVWSKYREIIEIDEHVLVLAVGQHLHAVLQSLAYVQDGFITLIAEEQIDVVWEAQQLVGVEILSAKLSDDWQLLGHKLIVWVIDDNFLSGDVTTWSNIQHLTKEHLVRVYVEYY